MSFWELHHPRLFCCCIRAGSRKKSHVWGEVRIASLYGPPKAGDSGRRKAESPPDNLRSSGKSAAGISGIPRSVGPTSAIGSTSSAKAAVAPDILADFKVCMSELLDERLAVLICNVDNLSKDVKDLKARVNELEREKTELASTVQPLTEDMSTRTHSAVSSHVPHDIVSTVRQVVEEECMQLQIRDNVIISGIEEDTEETLVDVLASLVPDIEASTFTAADRLGRPGGDRPRLIRAKMTATTKAKLIDARFGLKHGTNPVYVNHDLTMQQREARRSLLPKYKQLRSHGVKCFLPRDKILVDGKPIPEEKIMQLLMAPGQSSMQG